MRIGTKSLLYGYHQLLLHSVLVAWSWWMLFGFPWDPRLWVAFVVRFTEAWSAMEKAKPIAIDLFAGCGGLSLGLQKAGFDVRVAVEIEPVAAATYRANHPSVALLAKDICDVTAEEILSSCDRKVALVAGCAPCQGFCSLTTKNRSEDPRNRLVLEMTRLIEGIRPRAVMMENVPGLVQRGSKIFNQFLSKLKGASSRWPGNPKRLSTPFGDLSRSDLMSRIRGDAAMQETKVQ